MATRFYLHNDAAAYTPATIRGAWDRTSDAVTKRLEGSRLPTNALGMVSPWTGEATDEYDVLLYRGVSGVLAAGTIGTGTVDVMLPVYANNATVNLHYHLHIYVTQGDSDTSRGTLLSDYREAAGVNEWGYDSATCGRALNAPAALSSVTVSAGDRIVVEIGYAERNVASDWVNPTIYFGVPSLYTPLLVAGGPAGHVGYIEFSETFASSQPARVTQGAVDVAIDEDAAQAAIVSQGPVEVLMVSDNDPQRLTQVVVEYTDENATATARLTQAFVEILTPAVVASRLTQALIELLTPTVVESRWTQTLAEMGLQGTAFEIRGSQTVVELLGKSSTYCGPPSLSPAALCGKPDVLAWLEWTVPMKES